MDKLDVLADSFTKVNRKETKFPARQNQSFVRITFDAPFCKRRRRINQMF
jgi:hypothetical protein